MPLIKICGIKDPKTARFAAECGADYIGIVFAKASKRCVRFEDAAAIATAAKAAGAKPVGIFVDQTADEIERIADQTGISIVQTYGLVGELPERLERFECDFLLVDSSEPGSGKPFNWETFVPPVGVPWFLAGGLNADNVEEGILRFRPSGVDVSSGVETDGIKDLQKIRTFIARVKNCE